MTSAGNEGSNEWKKITFPSDSREVLTVGALSDARTLSGFSSRGFTADNRVKPDLVAIGTATTVVNSAGRTAYANGTSFSTPTLAGLVACLRQAFPDVTNQSIIYELRRSASKYKKPNEEMGYGIPCFSKAYKQLKKSDKGKE